MSTNISSSWVNDKVTPNVTRPSEKGPLIEIPLDPRSCSIAKKESAKPINYWVPNQLSEVSFGHFLNANSSPCLRAGPGGQRFARTSRGIPCIHHWWWGYGSVGPMFVSSSQIKRLSRSTAGVLPVSILPPGFFQDSSVSTQKNSWNKEPWRQLRTSCEVSSFFLTWRCWSNETDMAVCSFSSVAVCSRWFGKMKPHICNIDLQ